VQREHQRHGFTAVFLVQEAGLDGPHVDNLGAGVEIGGRRVERLTGLRHAAALVIVHDRGDRRAAGIASRCGSVTGTYMPTVRLGLWK